MKKYIGTKTVEAQPMTRWEAYEENILEPGTVVTDTDKNVPGYEVINDNGFHSWIPKEVFDKAYRLADTPLDRMKIELNELRDKINKLEKFTNTAKFDTLDERMQGLLRKQLNSMINYRNILRTRTDIMSGDYKIDQYKDAMEHVAIANSKVTAEQVKANMQDVYVRTEMEFGKPTTVVTVRMLNGFTIRESSTCVEPHNYNPEVGKIICLERIENKVWYLLGYMLQERRFKDLGIK